MFSVFFFLFYVFVGFRLVVCIVSSSWFLLFRVRGLPFRVSDFVIPGSRFAVPCYRFCHFLRTAFSCGQRTVAARGRRKHSTSMSRSSNARTRLSHSRRMERATEEYACATRAIYPHIFPQTSSRSTRFACEPANRKSEGFKRSTSMSHDLFARPQLYAVKIADKKTRKWDRRRRYE